MESACADILSKWRTYTDEVVGIFAETDGILHNTITPIARATSSGFECDLVLRNNVTTKERPLGVFHAGVFKRDKQGKEAFARFVEQLG